MGGPDFPLLIREILLAPTRARSRQEIVYRDQRRLDYPSLHQRVHRLGAALAALGVRPGETVAVMDWDSHRYLEAFFAVPMLGCVLFTVNVRLSPDQIAYTLAHAQVRVLICHTDFLPLLATSLPQPNSVTIIRASDDASSEYEALLDSADPAHVFPDLDENTPATLFYTTGTTGQPKGVGFTHRQIVLHTLAAAVALRLSPSDVYMPMTPMFHVHAWGVPYAATMLGLKQVYPGRYSPDMLLHLRAREGVTFSHCVPTILRLLLNSQAASVADLRGWRMVIGGAAMPRALCRAALDRGIDVVTGYGMSETCPLLTLAHVKPDLAGEPEQGVEFRVKAGLPLPLVDLRVVDPAMHDLPHDGRSAGEVVVRAPWLTQGYRDDPDASAALWSGGALHTGDIGSIDGHGYLSLTDRIKDVIKSGGEWISSLQIEDIIAVHQAVAEVAVIGVPDAVWGERPAALIVPKPGAALLAEEVRAHVAQRVARGEIAAYAVPHYVHFVDALPKTSVGKPDKKVMRQAFSPDGPLG